MRVDVERQAHVAVTEELQYELGIDALPQGECCAGVLEVVKAKATGQPPTFG